MTCTHDIVERDVAIADGYCPLCMADEIARLTGALQEIAEDPTGISICQAEIARRALENKP